jgi:UDP-glucose 6-dehydrogenase
MGCSPATPTLCNGPCGGGDSGGCGLYSRGHPQRDDSSVYLSAVAAVARNIGKAFSSGAGSERAHPLVVGSKSTVPIGTSNYVSMYLREGSAEG